MSNIGSNVAPLPEPCSVPATIRRIQTTPCTPEELVATLLAAMREAGANEITIESTRYDGIGPAIEFSWREERS